MLRLHAAFCFAKAPLMPQPVLCFAFFRMVQPFTALPQYSQQPLASGVVVAPQ